MTQSRKRYLLLLFFLILLLLPGCETTSQKTKTPNTPSTTYEVRAQKVYGDLYASQGSDLGLSILLLVQGNLTKFNKEYIGSDDTATLAIPLEISDVELQDASLKSLREKNDKGCYQLTLTLRPKHDRTTLTSLKLDDQTISLGKLNLYQSKNLSGPLTVKTASSFYSGFGIREHEMELKNLSKQKVKIQSVSFGSLNGKVTDQKITKKNVKPGESVTLTTYFQVKDKNQYILTPIVTYLDAAGKIHTLYADQCLYGDYLEDKEIDQLLEE